MIGVGYFMRHKSKFEFRTGLEFMFLNSSTVMQSVQREGDFRYTHPGTDVMMKYHMDFMDPQSSKRYTEQQNRFSVGLPVMFGAQFSRYYFLVGAKVNMGVWGGYSMRSPLTTYLEDPTLIDDLTNMPNHTLQTTEVRNSGSLKFGLDVTGSAEFGISLDEWMPSSALTIGRGRVKMPVSYRLGVFADYGFLNINANKKDGSLLHFSGDSYQDNGDGSFTIAAKDLNTVAPRSVLNANDQDIAPHSVINPLVVGAKFTVMFQVSPKPKPEKKRPRTRPRPKVIQVVPDPNFFYCLVSDFETSKPLDANVLLYNLENPTDTVFASVTDVATGFTQKEMGNGQFGIRVTRDGYIDYNDTLFQVLSDTIYVDLQPIKKNTIVILHNLFFDTDKTEIRDISTQSLEDLYQLLLKNPDMRIQITGHTDNTGSNRYNKRLSEGRAKAVYNEMVRRGIDPSRMTWRGRGSSEPIDTNDTPEGRAENRRVEFMIL